MASIILVINGKYNLLQDSLYNLLNTQLGDLIIIFHPLEINLSKELRFIPTSVQIESTAYSGWLSNVHTHSHTFFDYL